MHQKHDTYMNILSDIYMIQTNNKSPFENGKLNI